LFYRILQNRIKDWYRSNSRRHKLFSIFRRDDEEANDPVESHPDRSGHEPEQQLQSSRSVTELDAALKALPLRQQQAVMLRIWEGLDVAQTASIMGCTSGSVKTHYSRAVHSLRKQLGDHWP
jgi:RNA polymerase sigma-70 factor (ECF subfamily)